jgi:hypothetical protein
MCDECQRVLADLTDQDRIHFRQQRLKDTTNSRFSLIKAAIKRKRFGDPNASVAEILKQLKEKQDVQEKP